MNKIYKLCMLVVVVLGFSSCYNDFDEPSPAKVWTKEDFADSKLISIKELKDLFYTDKDQDKESTSNLGKYYEVKDDYVICGKVISSDQAGNVYKSVYIYDESSESAIELKLMVSNYVYYHIGQTLFVKVQGLAIGNYRYNLSLGGMPTAEDLEKGYANRNLDNTYFADQYVFKGELGSLNASDTLVINSSNYKTALTDEALGRLVRFEGLTYTAGSFDGDTYPQYLETTYPNGSTTAVYTNKYYANEGLIPTYAYSYDGDRYYGSSLFKFANATEDTKNHHPGFYIVRVSGYSNFSLEPLPANGAVGNITGIYNKYSSKTGSYIKYQLLLNSYSDINF